MTQTGNGLTILYVADSSSTHTKMFCDYMAKQPSVKKVVVFSLTSLSILETDDITSLEFIDGSTFTSPFQKLSFYANAQQRLRELIADINPDVIHTHFATSYGLISALACPGQYVLSVWGSDVFVYPKQSFFWRLVVKFSMKRALKVLSTSHAMAMECKRYTSRAITVTPFGIDTKQFSPAVVAEPVFKDTSLKVIGVVKRLEKVAGVDILLRAFARLSNKNYRLLIVGDGSQRLALEGLAQELNIGQYVHFTGRVPREQVQDYHRQLDLAVYPSRHESFGVSILESLSCGVPVIASNVEGLPEITETGKYGVLVTPNSEEMLADAIKNLLDSPDTLAELSRLGPEHVKTNYSMDSCLEEFLSIYTDVAS